MSIKIALTGGGTAGHVFPVVAVARAVKNHDPKAKFLWLGSKNGPEQEAARESGINFVAVPTGKLRRYFSWSNFVDLFRVPLGIARAYLALSVFRPDVLFSKGGYVSYPVVFAAWLHDVPILLHETDSVPGLANRRLAKKATLIATSFPESPKELPEDKTIFLGQPLREGVTGGSADRARDKYNLMGDKPVLVIFGGSQGAKSINKIIYQVLPNLLPHFDIVHQVGLKNVEAAKPYADKYYEQGYRMVGFVKEDLWDLYALADIIVARAGGQVHELAPLGKPVLLLPLAGSASNHQVNNAYAFEKEQAALVLEEANLTPQLFITQLMDLLHNNALRLRLGNSIKKFAAPRAAERIVYWIFRLAQLR